MMVDISQVSDMLSARAFELARELLPNGVREGQEYRVGSLAGERGRSMAVHLGGNRSGVWSDFSSGETGDALDLIGAVMFCGDKKQAFKWACAWLGLDGTDPARLKQTRRAVARRDAEPVSEDDETERARIRDNAFRMWIQAEVSLRGTLADAYLRSRALDLSVMGRQPGALRFAPALWNVESSRKWPALVAAISSGAGDTVAIHRTWLTEDGSGKAPLLNAKMTLGQYRGGSIRMWRGASGLPLADAPEGEPVVLTEGIEDALSIALACPELRVICAVSLANMAHVVLPAQIGSVIIAADNDGENAQAARALDNAIRFHKVAGREVRLARSPIGKDFNDCLRARQESVA